MTEVTIPSHSHFAPSSKLPKDEQIAIALDALRTDPLLLETLSVGCHARCFLTYRAIDGDLSPQVWDCDVRDRPRSNENDDLWSRARWLGSNATADAYFELLRPGGALEPFNLKKVIEVALFGAGLTNPRAHAPSILNHLRLISIACLAMLADGQKTSAGRFARSAIELWQATMGHLDVREPNNYFRWMEAVSDMQVLQMLQYVLMEAGVCEKQHVGWCAPKMIIYNECDEPWHRIMTRLKPQYPELWNPK